jgi:Tfp pilus assembly protein PilO
MNVQLTPRTLALVLAGVIVLLGIGGWFGLVGAQRNSASSLKTQIADAQVDLGVLSAKPAKPVKKPVTKGAKQAAAEKAAQIAQLRAAFPMSLQMPSVLLQVQRLAERSKVSLESFAPAMPITGSGYDSSQITLTVNGRYPAIQRFVHALRVQAGSSGGKVHATGRLFAVQSVNITAANGGLPDLAATIELNTFVYTGVIPTPPATTTDSGSTDGSTTTTTSEGTSS